MKGFSLGRYFETMFVMYNGNFVAIFVKNILFSISSILYAIYWVTLELQ